MSKKTVAKWSGDKLSGASAGLKQTEAERAAQAERNGARQLYRVSLWSPLLTALSLFAMPYLLFTGYRSRYPFVHWHTVQWALLTLIALFIGGVGLISDSPLFLMAIGGWYWGNLVGSGQVNRGECWLWRWWDDKAELPRPWALIPDAAPARTASTPSTAPAEALPGPVPAAPASAVPVDTQAVFSQGMALALQGQHDQAVAYFMTVYRDGPPYLRRRAVRELENLGEVETF